jgi:hypothetical protein
MTTKTKKTNLKNLKSYIGKNVTFFCGVYIYTGRLVGVDAQQAHLTSAKIVYETGELTSKEWTDAQPLPHDWHVMLHSIETFGVLK